MTRPMAQARLYDRIGTTYTVTRRTEPRIAARIWAALGDARTVLNVGAGTGSYEPPDVQDGPGVAERVPDPRGDTRLGTPGDGVGGPDAVVQPCLRHRRCHPSSPRRPATAVR